ncbi:MAG: methyl-accepting chemotaxis protein [Holosporales bacterium]
MSVSNHLRERLDFFGIDEKVCDDLHEAGVIFDKYGAEVIENFYVHLGKYPDLVAKFGGAENMSRVKIAQTNHWKTMFEAKFDDAYEKKVLAIGTAHQRIGLQTRWYLGGYATALSSLVDVVLKEYGRKPDKAREVLQAMIKASLLDMDLAITSYVDITRNSEIKSAMLRMSDALEASLHSAVARVIKLTQSVRANAERMEASIDRVSKQMQMATQAADQTKGNIQGVAAASEELLGSVKEISSQTSRSSDITASAVKRAQGARETIDQLATVASRIGEVVKLISDIASQTNLLALNATIEAARAGEAGKGFAVVAAEVKSLATQTAKATEEISSQVAAIQSSTEGAVQAMETIGATIDDVSQISTIIAGAVEEQNSATMEISRNMQQAAQDSAEISSNVEFVSSEVDASMKLAEEVMAMSEEVDASIQILKADLTKILRTSMAGNRREGERFAMALTATFEVPGGGSLSIRIPEASLSGAVFETQGQTLADGTRGRLSISGFSDGIEAVVIRPIRDGVYGVKFMLIDESSAEKWEKFLEHYKTRAAA